MDRLLIFEDSYRTVADVLASTLDLEVLVMDRQGAITRDGAPATEAATPTIGWATHDVFGTPVARDFMVALLKSPDLKWVQTASAGVDNPVFGQFVAKGAHLTTSHGQAVAMSDYVLWGVLDHFQRGPERRQAQTAHEWRKIEVRELADTRWLIVGFGAVGQGVAERVRTFGAHVTASRRNQSPHPLADTLVPPDRLAAVLPEADVVVLACPLTPATRHLANGAVFGAMKAGSVVVNVGRGGLVDEAALLAALDAGRPARAVLDVFETEPLPGDSPFWNHPRVTLTAHGSGIGAGQGKRNRALFLDNLARYLSGEPLLNEVSPADLQSS